MIVKKMITDCVFIFVWEPVCIPGAFWVELGVGQQVLWIECVEIVPLPADLAVPVGLLEWRVELGVGTPVEMDVVLVDPRSELLGLVELVPQPSTVRPVVGVVMVGFEALEPVASDFPSRRWMGCRLSRPGRG